MRKILLIDDEPAIIRVLSMSLRSDGHQVVTAGSGAEGIEAFRRERPGIVLTDIRMPGMDGLQVLRTIKSLDPDTEVIIVTGHGDIDVAIEALQLGASDFINKPVKDQALAIALKRAQEKLEIRGRLRSYTEDLENMVRIATREFERKSSFQAKLIQSSNDGIVATDDEWKVVIFNPGAQKIYGCTKTEVIRKTDARELFPEEVRTLFFSTTPPAQAKGYQKERPWVETAVTAADGERIPVRFSGTTLWEKSRMMGSVAFLQDLREIKRLERELVASERLAAIGQTVAGMAHCIKNILHGFKGGSYLVNVGIDRNNTDKLKNGWQMIQRNIARTSDLVLDLLSYSKEREPEYEPCRPNEIAEDVCDLLSAVAKDHQIAIVREFAPSVQEAVLDARTVHRCLMNLVSNAIDACLFDENITKSHWVKVATDIQDGGVAFSVSDNGSGMSEEVRKQLFTSFFSTKGAKGTGLGLLVTSKLVEEHNGRIDVSSTQGVGTTFSIWLPLSPGGPDRQGPELGRQ